MVSSISRQRLALPSRWILVALLLIFFGVWCHNLGLMGLTSDEAATGLMADMSMGGIYRQNQDSPHGPVYNLSMRAWRLVTGSVNEFTARYLSVLLGALLLALVYSCGRALGLNVLGALAVVVLIGLNPQITVHLREARPYAPMLVTMALATTVTLRFERLKFAPWLAAVASVLALLTHYFAIPFVATLGLWGFLYFKGRTRRQWVISQGVAWVFLAVWLPLFGRAFFNPNSLKTGKTWSFLMPAWETLARIVGAGAVGYREYPTSWLAYVAGALLVAAWLAGCVVAAGRRRGFLALMVAWPLFLYALVCWVRPVFHPKYVVPWLLFASLAVGMVVSQRPRLGAVLAVGLLALMAGPTWRTLQQPYDPGVMATADLSPVQRESARALLSLADRHDTFASGTPDPVHCYYLQHYFNLSLNCDLVPKYPTQTVADLTAQVTGSLTSHRLLWYLDFYNPYWDPQHVADAVFSQSLLSLGAEQVAGRGMRLFTLPATVTQEQTPLGAQFGQVAELDGTWVVRTQSLHVVLVWHSLADQPNVSANEKVFVHVLDENGQVVAQADGVPLAWTRPLNTWHKDEQLLDVYNLPLAPGDCASSCSLQIGLYDPATSVRLPAADSAGHALPDDAAVVSLSPWSPAQVEMRH
jgi:hypothetical protein